MKSKAGGKIANNNKDIGTAMPDEALQEAIRLKAYSLYEARGCEGGHALEDWLQAETEFNGLAEDADRKISA